MIYTPVIWIQLLAALLLGGICLSLLRYSSHSPAARMFALMTGISVGWIAVYTLAISTTDLTYRVLLGNINICFAAATATVPLAVALAYIGRNDMLTRRTALILSILPAFIGIMALTSPFHTFFRTNFRVDESGALSGLLFTIGPGYAFYLAYLFGINILSAWLLLRFARANTSRVGSTLLIVAGIFAPILSGILFSVGITPLRGFDFSPASTVFSGILFFLALRRGHWLDVVPIAYRTVVEHIDDFVFVLDVHGDLVQRNRSAVQAFAENAGNGKEALPEPWKEILTRYAQSQDQELEVALPLRAETRHFDLAVSVIRVAGDKPVGQLFVFHDITRRKDAEARLQESEAKFRAMSDHTATGLFIVRGGRFLFVNPAVQRITGFAEEELLSLRPIDVIHPDSREKAAAIAAKRNRGEAVPPRYELKLMTKAGEERWADLSAEIISFGGESATLGTLFDITDRKRLEGMLRKTNEELHNQLGEVQQLQDQLQEQAVRDAVTGLFNRRYLEETLEREISGAKRAQSTIGVMMMDLDRFKSLNDTHGHAAGDLFLETFGRLLRAQTRQMDIACRYGGEEFVIVMPKASLEVTRQRADSLRQAAEGMRVVFQGKMLAATVSIGVAIFPDHGGDCDSLLRSADDALYESKRNGRNLVTVYSPPGIASR